MTLAKDLGITEAEGYIFVRNGRVQYVRDSMDCGMLVAGNRSAARKMQKLVPGASIADVGSIPGETLEDLAAVAIQEGAGIFISHDGNKFSFYHLD